MTLARPRYGLSAASLSLALALAAAPASAADGPAAPPRLIVQITVDALRADMPMRFQDGYRKGGWRTLLDEGLHYTNAHYQHANTETIVGHASLATGAYPAEHGMVANVWLDRASGELSYNIEDPDHRLLTSGADVDRKTEIDPTQRMARSEGRSPARIRVSTFADQLALHTAGKARIFAVSVKDRGAVSMAGHAGKAFWFSKAKGEFTTSSYYYDALPEWVNRFNAAKHPQRYGGTEWTLSGPASEYLFGGADDVAWETALPGWGRTFPHPYGEAAGKEFTTFLTLSPAGDELTLDFAKSLVENEALGQDAVTDYLAISFSATDYINHLFGPSSLEAEDNQHRLDRTLANLFAFLDEKVGLAHTLIVLSADHGSPEVPGHLGELGIPGGYFEPDEVDRQPAMIALKKRFGIGGELIKEYFHPYLYLNRELIARKNLDQAKVEAAVAAEVAKLPGIRMALPATALSRAGVAETWLTRAVLANHDPVRSGDIYVVFEAQHFIRDFDGLMVAATHGSPWRYDTHVPIFFLGPGIKSGNVARAVTPYDIAPTLATLLGAGVPSGAVGVPLPEVLPGASR